MQSKLEKVVAGLKTGPRFLKELREFDNLVKAIGECKSKAEEDRVISQEVELLKQRLSDPKLDKSRGKEYMIRLMYCEILGHDASFAYVKALQFASDPNIHTKKAAYLALTQFLDYNDNLVLLLVNTLLLDMKSDNYLIVCTALVAATRLIGPDLVNAVYPVVVERLRHPKEHVRKKAVMTLHWFSQLDPRREGPLAGVELDKHFRTLLCDKDPSVMSASLCALHDCVKADPRPYKNLIPSFTSILKQVSEHRLPKTYDYHRFPAPFIQIKLLKILAALGAGDRTASENMAAVLHQTLRRANTSHTIGSAIIYECVRTITTIYPNPQLLAAAAEGIATFLRSSSHNLRYVGIDALAGITALNPAAASEHQVAVLDCLEDPDDTLKLKTLELLYKMTKANNIQVIVDRMMGFLSSCTDEHIRKDIVRKVCDLAERYAPSPGWFVTTISEVFRLGGEHVDEADTHRLVRLIAEQDASLHASAVEAYLELLDGESAAAAAAAAATAATSGSVTPLPKAPRKKLPETILLVICWVLGEFGHLARRPPPAVLGRLVGILNVHKAASDRLRSCLLTALVKLAAHTGGAAGPVGQALLQPHGTAGGSGGPGQEAADLLHKCMNSQSVELQQRAHELQALLRCSPVVMAAALPVDASCEEFSPQDLVEVAGLPFLEGHVARALAGGAAPYLPSEARGARAGEGTSKGLRFEAYEPAPHAIPLAAASTSYTVTGAYDSRSGSVASAAGLAAPAGGPAATSVSPAASTTAGPQLVLKGAGGRKWGPAHYETDDGTSASVSSSQGPLAAAGAVTAPPQPAAASRSGGNHSRSGSAASLPAQAPPSERERLAASLFGGLGSSSGGASAASRPPAGTAPPAPAVQRQVTAATSTRTAATPNPMDLLLDLDVPAAQQQRPTGPLPGSATFAPSTGLGAPPPLNNWMDSMMSPPPGPAPSASPLAGGAGALLVPSVPNGGGGMMYNIQAPMSPTAQQQQLQPGSMGIGMGLGAGLPMGGSVMPAQQYQQLLAPAPALGMGMGVPGGPMGYGAGAPLQPPQAWQHPQQQLKPSGMVAAAGPPLRPPQQQTGRSANPFGDLLG